MSRTWQGLTTVLILVVALAATAIAAPSQPTAMKAARHKDGPYVVTNFGRVNVGEDPKNVYYKITNQTKHAQQVTLTDQLSGADSDYEVRWFKGENEITIEVQGSGDLFTLRKKSSRRRSAIVRARIEAITASPGEFCLAPHISVQPDAFEYSYSTYINSDSVCG